MAPLIHVVAAVIVDDRGRYLVAQRAAHKHQGGCWEFPGGKVDPGETEAQALTRELAEEIGLTPTQQRPLLRVCHDYGDRRIVLSAWLVTAFIPGPRLDQSESEGLVGLEGQPLLWVSASELPTLHFPDANRPILAAALLPTMLRITPTFANEAAWQDWLSQRLRQPVSGQKQAIILRQPNLEDDTYLRWAAQGLALCQAAGVAFYVHGSVGRLERLPEAAGVHLPFAQLTGCERRPVADDKVLLVACHSAEELSMAQQIGADCALLSSVLATASHPKQNGLGWSQWAELVEAVNIPVYALGGMTPDLLTQAWAQGGQGVAGISGF
ncbi:MAG: Nudix family hydrolase [Moraxellaceae bacterium]|nr:Nudix family hydrolase [Moraxellaceae bacterium]MDP1775953.1 Nudix family hydrolase [Moraxellaceae bacterium]